MSLLTLIADVVVPASDAPQAGAAQSSPAAGLTSMIPFLLIIGVMIFLMFRSNQKQQKKRQEMLDKLVKGARVVLAGGMFGKVIEVREKSCLVEIAHGVTVEVSKNGVVGIGDEDLAPADKN